MLEGLTRNIGVHAAGVVISDRDLSEYIPLTRANDGTHRQPVLHGAAHGSRHAEDGLPRPQDAHRHHRRRGAHPPAHARISTSTKIPLDDQTTFDLLNRGETVGLFQLESGGMVNVCRQFDIKDIEDINAILALYRPGPMDLIPDYIKRKKGREDQIRAQAAGEGLRAKPTASSFTRSRSCRPRRCSPATRSAAPICSAAPWARRTRRRWRRSASNSSKAAAKLNNIDEKKANEIFDLLEKFAGYGFNRSHSAAYAWVSYQTAFLKANYPVEFMAAVLSNEITNTDKISIFVGECKRMGIEILPPDVNRSALKFIAGDRPDETPGHPLRPGGDQERGRSGDGSGHRGAAAARPVQIAGRFLRAGSTPAR